MNATQLRSPPSGNLTGDANLRFTPNGKAVATVGIAVNYRIRRGEGWADGAPSFYDVALWKEIAEHAVEPLREGDRGLVTGHCTPRRGPTADRRPSARSRSSSTRRSAPRSG